MRRPDPVPASRQPQPERGPFPPSVQPLARIPTTPPRLRRRAGGTGEGHDTQGSDCTGKKPSPPGHGRPTDRRPSAGSLPSGRIPSGNAAPLPRGGRAVSLEASMNNTLDVIFLGKDDARHARLIEALSHLGFNAPLPRTGRCVSATPGARARWWCWKRRCPTCTTRRVARHRPGPGHRRHRRLPRRRKPDTHAAVRRRRLPVARSQRTGAGRGLAGAGGRAAGMDAEPGEIAANGEPPSDAWRLANKGWTLISPAGAPWA